MSLLARSELEAAMDASATANASELGRARAEIERLRSAWLYSIQCENICAADGKPCHSHKCACAIEMQSLIDGTDR